MEKIWRPTARCLVAVCLLGSTANGQTPDAEAAAARAAAAAAARAAAQVSNGGLAALKDASTLSVARVSFQNSTSSSNTSSGSLIAPAIHSRM